jgi:Uma2 family endonuclease
MEEILVQTDLSDYEKERGKNIPSLNHSIIQLRLGVELARHKQFTIVSELTVKFGNWKRTPDLCIYPKLVIDWRHDVSAMTTPPFTAVEIMSPSQSADEFSDKLDLYFQAGVKSVWLVQPFFETIALCLPNQKPKVFTEGEFIDETTGVRFSLGDVFSA